MPLSIPLCKSHEISSVFLIAFKHGLQIKFGMGWSFGVKGKSNYFFLSCKKNQGP